jgi:hypothetical protein
MTKVVQLPENGGMSHVFENLLMKAFQNIWQPFFCGDWKNSIIIWKIMMVGWLLKNISHHKDVWLKKFN